MRDPPSRREIRECEPRRPRRGKTPLWHAKSARPWVQSHDEEEGGRAGSHESAAMVDMAVEFHAEEKRGRWKRATGCDWPDAAGEGT